MQRVLDEEICVGPGVVRLVVGVADQSAPCRAVGRRAGSASQAEDEAERDECAQAKQDRPETGERGDVALPERVKQSAAGREVVKWLVRLVRA